MKTIKEIKLSEYREKISKGEFSSWSFLDLMPHGKISTKEQYDYVINYGKHMGIGGVTNRESIENLPYEKVINRYIWVGSNFGGAVFYFFTSDIPEPINPDYEDGEVSKCDGYYEDFTYGKYGKFDFDN